MPFYVKIHGSNAIIPYAYGARGDGIHAPSEGGEVRSSASGRRALFPTREAARAAGLACHWNNQQFSVHVGRHDSGVLLGEDQEWASCQDPDSVRQMLGRW